MSEAADANQPVKKSRKDKLPPERKMRKHLPIKLTQQSRQLLHAQAAAAGYKSSGYYLRKLATDARAGLNLPPHDFNDGIG
jgi:hypothetical protein